LSQRTALEQRLLHTLREIARNIGDGCGCSGVCQCRSSSAIEFELEWRIVAANQLLEEICSNKLPDGDQKEFDLKISKE